MSSTSMTPPTKSPVADEQLNVEFDWSSDSHSSTPLDWGFQPPLDPDLSNFSAFSDIDSLFGPELSFEGLSPKTQSTGGTQEYLPEESLLVGSSGLAGDDIVSITILGSTTAKPLDISAPEYLERHTSIDVESSTATVQTREEYILSLRQKLKREFFPKNQELTEDNIDEISSDLGRIEKAGTIPPSIIRDTKIRRLFRTIITLEMIPRDNELQIKERVSRLLTSWAEPAILSTTQAQSKSAPPQTLIDLTGADSDHEYVTPPDTPKSGLLPTSSTYSNPSISTETNSRPASNGNSNTKKRKSSLVSSNSTTPGKCRRTQRVTTVKQHLADEMHHSSQWLAGMEKSINDCEADLVALEEKKARFLAEIEEKREEVTRRKNEFIELKNSMVAWGARNEVVSEEWKSCWLFRSSIK
ncbi:hypothetical protein HYALB_00011915 [Hymenoscyphus albidus]|uniref:Uncharacterized protein n=1 Tax=Hymenoscyphus albidus TaxID=595503 RepID=A0A9N9QA03_9HELO|nr:hypothetical protein HYALB_00011915 [Hymenoscyphus albidus]